LIRITDRTLSCLDELPHEKEALSRFLALLIELDPGAIELSERMFRLLSPLPEYPYQIQSQNQIQKYLRGEVSPSLQPVGQKNARQFSASPSTGADRPRNAHPKVKPQNRIIRICGMDGALCGDYIPAFTHLKNLYNGNIEFCPSNRFHCATALAAEWITSGAGSNVVTSFGGIGGFAPTEELMMILRLNGLRSSDRVYDFLPEMSNLFTKITHKHVRQNKPIIGNRIFHVESSIHVDGILKQPECYEPFPPETVGLSRKIILGKQSGAASIRAKLLEFNIKGCDENIPVILEKVKAKAIEKGGAVTDREFIKITKEPFDNINHAVYTIYNDTQSVTQHQTNSVYVDKQLTTEYSADNAKPRRYIVDSTLRDGEQTSGLCFSAEQKLKIAELLDVGGVHQIEAGVPAASRQEKENIAKIIKNRKNAVISVWARLVPSDIEHAVDVQPDIIHVCIPVSRTHIYKKLRKDEDWVINQLRICLSLVEKCGIPLSVGFEDAFRADAGFMLSIARILLDSGVTRIRFSDTVGVASPTLCCAVLNNLSSELNGEAEFGIHAHNDLGMAVANTIEAAKAGCLYADTTANGIGERAGNCDMAQLVHASASIFDWGMSVASARETQREIGKIIRHGFISLF